MTTTQIAVENFNYIQKLPIVRELLKDNKKLKRRVKELRRLVRLISNNARLFRGEDSDDDDEDDIEIVEPKKKRCIKIIDVDDNLEVGPPVPVHVKIEKEKENDNIKLVVEEDAVEEEEEAEEGGVRGATSEAGVATASLAPAEEEEESVRGAAGVATASLAPAEEEDEEVYEIIIKGKTYYTSNEQSGAIYGVDANGDVSMEVGVFKDGKAVFNK